MYLKAESMSPPWHPEFYLEQSTSCCSEKDWSLPVEVNIAPSTAPVVEKAQHDPHCPWFLTGTRHRSQLGHQGCRYPSQEPGTMWIMLGFLHHRSRRGCHVHLNWQTPVLLRATTR